MAESSRSSSSEKSDSKEAVLEYAKNIVEFGKWGMENSGVIDRRNRAKRYYRGDHKVKSRDPRLGRLVWNKFAQIARNRTAHIISKKPKWRFQPKQEAAIFLAEGLSNILNDVLWDKMKWDKKGEMSVNEARDAGSSHIKIIIRPDGFPDAIPRSADQIIIDPKAKTKENLRFWCDVYPMGVKKIEQRYGVRVSADSDLENMHGYSTQSSSSYLKDDTNKAPISAWKEVKFKSGTDWMPDFIGRATIYELWLEDDTMEPIPYKKTEAPAEHQDLLMGKPLEVHPLENHPQHVKNHQAFLATLKPPVFTEGGEIVEENDRAFIELLASHIEHHLTYDQVTQRKKYSFGRKIVFCQDKLLEDKPNPIAANMKTGIDFRDLLIKWDYDPDGDRYWGKQGIADLFDPQDAFNHRKNAITQMINRLNHGVKTVRQGTYDTLRGNLKSQSNLIATIIPVRNHDDLKIDYGPQAPTQIWEDLFHSENFMDVVMDHTDIVAGRFPKGSPPGVTVNQLLGEGMKPINLIVKHYAEALKEMARTIMLLMVEYVPDETKFRMIDDKKQWQYMDWSRIKDTAGYFDIHVDVDSMLATTRQEKLETSLRLKQEDVYDREAVLNNLDDPDKYEIIQRMSEIALLKQALGQYQEAYEEEKGERKRLEQNLRAREIKDGSKSEKDKSKK